jgi:LAO/AO transport system kinase
MEDKIKEEIQKKAINNRLPCAVARKIALDLSVPYKEVGIAADELRVKITACELGCF